MSRASLSERIDAIEAGYEYCLAYAAQGYEAGASDGEARRHLTAMAEAADGLAEDARAVASEVDGDAATTYAAFLDALETDATKARGAVMLVLARDGISSQLVDNLNASMHVRALLTDLFVLDEALKR